MKVKTTNNAFCLAVLFGVLALAAMLLAAPAAWAQSFTPTGSMSIGRTGHTATLLTDGRVLIAGGSNKEFSFGYVVLATAEIYDPKSGTFTPTPVSMSTARRGHTATLLRDGRVLIAGGNTTIGNPPFRLYSAEIYDPNTGTFTPTGSMSTPREGHAAVLLGNGKVLVAGGWYQQQSAELYDPATGSFTATGSMTTARDLYTTATLLRTGQVLVVGGDTFFGGDSAELYNPNTGTFTPTGSMSTTRYQHSATLLSSGSVLVAGGSFLGDWAEVYQPSTGTFIQADPTMISPRLGCTANLLPDGQVLIVGGTGSKHMSGIAPLSTTELYQKEIFSAAGRMARARHGHTATLLPGGRVLVTGGSGFLPEAFSEAELYDPAREKEKKCVAGTSECGWHEDDLFTFGQGVWAFLTRMVEFSPNWLYFSTGGVFEVGISGVGGYSMVFGSGDAILNYLPASGPPGPLMSDLLDPTSSASGVFGGDVVALKLNIDFSDGGLITGNSGLRFGDLTMCNFDSLPAINHLKVRDFLAVVNSLLGGGSASYGIDQLDPVTQDLNLSFLDGNPSAFAHNHLVNGACP